MCVNYGGRAEIADAVSAIAAEVAAGRLKPGAITEKTIQKYLDEPDLPDVDLFLRSSGEQRLSNFMLWQSAYAEIVFLDTLWPDVDRRTLWDAVEIYAQRDRRYGGAIDAAPGPASRRQPGPPAVGPAPATGAAACSGRPGVGPDPTGQPGVGVARTRGADRKTSCRAPSIRSSGHGTAQARDRRAIVFTSRTASVRRMDSFQTIPLALAPEIRTRMGTSMFRPRATLDWPASTALSQPARTGKACGGR